MPKINKKISRNTTVSTVLDHYLKLAKTLLGALWDACPFLYKKIFFTPNYYISFVSKPVHKNKNNT